ncbi:unnamed protein product, partial [Nesidiocoris tenuis]
RTSDLLAGILRWDFQNFTPKNNPRKRRACFLSLGGHLSSNDPEQLMELEHQQEQKYGHRYYPGYTGLEDSRYEASV